MMSLKLLAAACLAPVAIPATAQAEILTSFAWIQGSPGSNFSVMHADLDTETGVLSVFGDYQGLQDDLGLVRVDVGSGESLGTLAFDGSQAGFARGNFGLDAAQLSEVQQSGIQVSFITGIADQVEMGGLLGFTDHVTRSVPMDGGQVVGGGGAPVNTTMNLSRLAGGNLFLTCDMGGIDLPMTALELHGPAASGEVGPLVLDLLPFDLSQSASVFFVEVDPTTFSSQELDDLMDGFSYVLVRTAQFPGGALRAQTSTGPIYTSFCAGRANSQSQIGGRLSLGGSVRIADASLEIAGQFFPDGQFVLPIVGHGSGHTYLPGSSRGTLCVDGAPITRLLAQVTQGQGLSSFSVSLDLGQIPSVRPGDTLRFQCWHRDVVHGEQTSNFSNAVSVRVR